MSVPSTIIFPLHADRILSGNPEQLEKYFRELIFTLENMYESLSQGINGDFRTDFLDTDSNWTPLLRDTVNSGTTFTYSHQIGWVIRKGLMVDAWFDIGWTNNIGSITGNMYIELPYEVAITNQKPFVGLLQPSGFTYSGGTECVINGISDSFRGEIWNTGSGFNTSNQSSVSSGQLIGHLRYVGKRDE